MKKLLALVMVLGFVSFASAIAAPLYLTVDGQEAPEVMDKVLPSTYFEIDVEALAGLRGGEFTLMVVGNTGSFDASQVALATQYVNVYIPGVYTGKANWDFAWKVKAGTTPSARSLTVDGGNFSTLTILPETLAKNIMFHCDGVDPKTGKGDVEIQLYAIVNDQNLGLVDSLLVHQIPEPMTMSLLGLGGLFLARRRA